MAVKIGGVSVGVGMDATQFFNSLKTIDERLTKFQRDMKNIRLDAVFEGDPFSNTLKYMDRAKLELGNVFKSWRQDIGYVAGAGFSELAHKSKRGADSVIRDWERVSTKVKELRGLYAEVANVARTAGTKKGQTGMWQTTAVYEAGVPIGEARKLTQSGEAVRESLKSIMGVGGRAGALAGELWGRLGTDQTMPAKQVAKMMAAIRRELSVGGKEVVKEYEKFGQKLKEAMKVQDELMYKERLTQAKDPTLINKKRTQTIRELTIAKTRLRKEEEMGYFTSEKRSKLMDVLRRQQELGVRLTKRETKELKKYTAEQKRGEHGFLSREWFKHRARWFVELRLLWGAYRAFGDAIRSTIEFEHQLSRAMRTSRSEMMSNIEIANKYKQAMKEAISLHGVDWKEAGEVLYQLGSAGLSSEEALAGLNSVLSLIVGTEGDAREVTKAVAGIYNNFADTITHVTTKMEKLEYIANVMATIWRDHQVEMNEIVDGFKHSSAMAKIAGLDIETLSAVIAVLNDHMIKGGKAGRSFTTMLSRISRQSAEFADVFGVSIKYGEVLNLEQIMGTLHRRLKDGVMSVDEMGEAFQRMGIRAAPTFMSIVQYWDEVKETQEEVKNSTESLMKLEEEMLKRIDGQMKKFVSNLKAYAVSIDGLLGVINASLKFWNELMTESLSHKAGWFKIFKDSRDELQGWTELAEKRRGIIEWWEKHPISAKLMDIDLNQLRKDLDSAERMVITTRRRMAHAWKMYSRFKSPGGLGEDDDDKLPKKPYRGESYRKFYQLHRTGSLEKRVSEAEKDVESARRRVELREKDALKGGKLAWDRAIKAVQELKKLESELLKLKREKTKEEKRAIALIAEKQLNTLKEQKTQLQIQHGDRSKILEIDKKIAEVGEWKLEQYKRLTEDDMERMRIFEKIRDKKIEILKIEEKQRRNAGIQYNFMQKMKDQAVEFHDLMTDSLVTFTTGSARGIGTVMTDITGGFQEQKQEIINLRAELGELGREYDEALTEGDVERAEQIANEMQRLRENIEELEDPIENVKEGFRVFFKDLIDQIRQTINEWIALQILMGVLKVAGVGASGGGGGISNAEVTAAGSNVDFSGVGMATGGVLPHIESFRTFSRGGMTNRPTLAVLGDNKSGREIVIPEENIKSDHVSGYVRDGEEQSPINVINLIAPEDVAVAMANKAGERVIVNQIGKWMNSRGKSSNTIM